MTDERIRALKLGGIAIAFVALPWFASSSYLLRVFTLMTAFALFTVALNIVFGHTDQLFLFVGGLAGIGAYTTVISADILSITPWLTLPLGVLAAGVLGASVSYIAAKRRFTVILIAVFTLTLQLAIVQFFVGARSFTGGSTGLPVDVIGVDQRLFIYYVLVGVLIGYLLIYDRLIHSRYGIAFSSIREDELAAESVGINVVRYKVIAGFLAALMIGLAGALYGFSEGYLTPSIYSFQNIDVMILIMLTLGGMRTVYGPIVGTAFIFWVQQSLASSSEWRLIVFGTLLIVLFLYFREGIVPKVAELVREWDLDTRSITEALR